MPAPIAKASATRSSLHVPLRMTMHLLGKTGALRRWKGAEELAKKYWRGGG
ncbi:MAG: hypothetical protein Q9187_008839 [Circinaria calcarea]